VGELDHELFINGAKCALDFSSPLGPPGPAVHELHTEHRASPERLVRDHSRAVVQIDPKRQAPRRDARAERRFQAESVFQVAPALTGEGS